MHELTREQEAKIAQLAIDNASVSVAPQESGAVLVMAGGLELMIDADGQEVAVPIEVMSVRLPVALVRDLIGNGPVDDALADVAGKSYPEVALGRALAGKIRMAIIDATDRTVA